MGFFKDFFKDLKNPAEGIRNAMRSSYKKHRNLREAGHGPGHTTPHHAGLYGALGSRYQVRGIAMPEGIMWGELSPFMLMDELTSVEALAEYVVFQQVPKHAKIEWLTQVINDSLRGECSKDILAQNTMASYGFFNQVSWVELLEDDVMKAFEKMLKHLK